MLTHKGFFVSNPQGRRLHHHVFTTMLLLLSVFSLNCFNEPLAPVAPSWNTHVTFPLANRFYSIADIVQKDTSLLRVGVGNVLSYATSVSLSPTYVGDLISLSPKDTSVHLKIGAFSISAPPVREAVDIPWLPRGSSVPIPDTTVTFDDIETTVPTFQNVSFRSGTISLLLENKLPVPMEVTGPIHLLDAQNNIIATFSFNPSAIPPNGSRLATDDLAERSMDSQIRISNLTFHTPGSSTPVQIPTGDLFVATLSTENLKARRAVFASIPDQRLANTDTTQIRLDDSTMIKDATMKSGSLRLAFVNNISLNVTFKYRFTELLRRSGNAYIPFEDSVFLPSRGSGVLHLDLANARISSPNGDLVRSLRVLSSVSIQGNSGQSLTVNDTDKVSIVMTRNAPIIVDSASAVIKPTWISVDTKVPVNFGSLPSRFSGQLNIPAASLGLATVSTFGFPADLYIKLGARKNAAGDSVFLNVPVSQRRLQPGSDHIVFDASQVGQFLSQISGRIPDSLRIVGRILVNPPDVYSQTVAGTGNIGRGCHFGGQVDLEIPMNVGIIGGSYSDTLALGDTTGDGTRDHVLDKSILKDLNSGKIFFEVQNGLPIQVELSMQLLNRSRQPVLVLPQSGDPLHIAAARVDGEGKVTVPAERSTFIQLDRDEVQQINPAEFLRYSLGLVTTPGSPSVRFKTTDYIRVRIWSTLSYKVNG